VCADPWLSRSQADAARPNHHEFVRNRGARPRRIVVGVVHSPEEVFTVPSFVVKECTREDAQKVADLMNASDAGWPGGFMRGSVLTAEEVMRWHEREESLPYTSAIAAMR